MAQPERVTLPEDIHDDRPRLGRHIHRDPRSLNFMVEAAPSPHLASVHHDRMLPILDQGQLGSCTANAFTGLLGTHPFWDTVGRQELGDGDPVAAENYAVQIYSDATRNDGFPGAWKPDDTGSTGLAVCKVAYRRGLISSYRWARTTTGFARLLQDGPVLFGTVWLEEFFDPDRDGFIDSGDLLSPVAGGHEVEVVGIELADPIEDSVLELANSWSTGWGDNGFFRMRLSTYVALRDYADLKQPLL